MAFLGDHTGCCVENRLGRSPREMEAQVVIQVREGSVRRGQCWTWREVVRSWIFFPKENKKDSRSVVRSERKGNGRLELLLTKTGGLWSRGRGELSFGPEVSIRRTRREVD